MAKLLGGVLTLVLLAWVALYFSGKAVLVTESDVRENGVMKTFTCRYFDGMKMLEKEQVFSDIPLLGQVGSARCPRLIDLDGQPAQ